MKKIKVKYIGFWDGFVPQEYRMQKILEKYYDVSISDDPEYVFCSLYNGDFLKYRNAIKIFITAENVIPDFNLFDYCIGFDELTFADRYIRVPNFLMNLKYENAIELMKTKHLQQVENNRQFCSFVVSNGNADPMRDLIFEEIGKYKKVSSGGRYRNNINQPDGVLDKLQFQKNYKFSLALENTLYKGYTTEKIIEAFAAGSIPIYWGDPDVGKYFNTNAFVNISDFMSLDDAIREIKRIDNNETLYQKYLKEPALNDQEYIEKELEKLEAFIQHIIDQPWNVANRKLTGVWGNNIYEIARRGTNNTHKENYEHISKIRKLLDKYKGK